MQLYITPKLHKAIWTIFWVIIILVVAAALYGAVESHRFYSRMVTDINGTTDNIILEWAADSVRDTATLEQIDRDLVEAQARLEKLGVEFDEVNK
jgi:hypothetical protein